MRFESREDLAHHLLDRLLPHCRNHRERVLAAVYAAVKAEELWVKNRNGA